MKNELSIICPHFNYSYFIKFIVFETRILLTSHFWVVFKVRTQLAGYCTMMYVDPVICAGEKKN